MIVAEADRNPMVDACEQALSLVEHYVVRISSCCEVDPKAGNVKTTNHSEIFAENTGTYVMYRFKEFASEFKSVMVALKKEHYLQLAQELQKKFGFVSKSCAKHQRTALAMEKALEKVFDQFLVKNGIMDVAHSDMVAHSVCDEFEVWWVLGWKV